MFAKRQDQSSFEMLKETLEFSCKDLHRQNTYLHRCQIHLLRTKKDGFHSVGHTDSVWL